MQALRGITWLLLLQSIGEVISRALHLPLPGPVVGMLLLLFALRWHLVHDSVSVVAEFLLQHLSLLFVPVGVGVMTHLDVLGKYGARSGRNCPPSLRTPPGRGGRRPGFPRAHG